MTGQLARIALTLTILTFTAPFVMPANATPCEFQTPDPSDTVELQRRIWEANGVQSYHFEYLYGVNTGIRYADATAWYETEYRTTVIDGEAIRTLDLGANRLVELHLTLDELFDRVGASARYDSAFGYVESCATPSFFIAITRFEPLDDARITPKQRRQSLERKIRRLTDAPVCTEDAHCHCFVLSDANQTCLPYSTLSTDITVLQPLLNNYDALRGGGAYTHTASQARCRQNQCTAGSEPY